MKKAILASLAAMIILTGCNTFKGIGKDISSAGEGVTQTAEDVEQKL